MSEKQNSDSDSFSIEKKKKSKSKSKGKKKGKKEEKKQPKKKKEKGEKQNEKKSVKKRNNSKSKAKSVDNPKEALKKIRDYMEKQNRPYSVINVFDNLHKTIKKAQVEACLDQLVAEQFLVVKSYGKNNVYFLNQANIDIQAEQLKKKNEQLCFMREDVQQKKKKHKQLNDYYRNITSSKTTEQLREECSKLKEKINRLSIKKNILIDGGNEKISEEIVLAAEKEQISLQKELKKRKKMVKQCLESWAEGMEKKVKQVAELMGIDY